MSQSKNINNINIKDKDNNQFLQEFIDARAILEGHFILSSGLHSNIYMQCARVLMNPSRSQRLCKALANKIIEKLGNNFCDIVLSPAMGGVVVGYELAKQLNYESIFCERVNGNFELRRGFEIEKGARVLVVEDVITTGKSSLETFDLVKQLGGLVVAEACLVDRSSNKNLSAELKVPVISLIEVEVKTFDSNNIPDELKDITAVKPGSRLLQK